MSECAACHTLAEGVELARAVERSGVIYMLAENYPYAAYVQEMRRLYREGTIGEFQYGEGEYVHPDTARAKNTRSCGYNHWRNWIPATYYCTHSVGPVMYVTDTRPVRVNGLVVPYDEGHPTLTRTARRSDVAATIMCRMDNGALMKSLHGGLRGHQNYVRIHGNRGLMENCRTGDMGQLRLRREPWEKPEGEPREMVYSPDFPEHDREARRTGHGGGDYFTTLHFAEAIRSGTQPYLDVYRGIDMTLVGIQAWRSALNQGAPEEIPDFRDESVRREYEEDHWSPDPTREEGEQAPTSILGDIEPSEKALEFCREVWREQGYEGE
jgi:predicted dehydrogenase